MVLIGHFMSQPSCLIESEIKYVYMIIHALIYPTELIEPPESYM